MPYCYSVDKQLVVENQSEQTLAARRIIKDHIIHVNGVTNVEITRNMVVATRNARARLGPTKGRTGGREMKQKRKEETDAMHELEGKRKQLKMDVSSLLSSPLQRNCVRSVRKVESYR